MSLYIASGRSRLERGVMKRLVTLGNPSSSLGQVGVGGVSHLVTLSRCGVCCAFPHGSLVRLTVVFGEKGG